MRKINGFRALISLCLAICMAASLAGCGGQEQTSGNGLPVTGQESQGTEGPASSAGTQTLRLRIGSDPANLFPWGPSSSGGDVVRQMMYEKLLFANTQEKIFENWLAETVVKESDEVYTVTIYDYITDSQGNALTADDIIFSYNLAIDAGTVTTNVADLDHIEKIDDYTVRFYLKPSPAIGSMEACLSGVNIITEAAWEASGDEMTLHPIGTGRYVLTDTVSGTSWSFEKRDDYWQTDESKLCSCVKGNIEKVETYYISDTSASAIALESGQVDCSMISAADSVNFLDDSGNPKDGYIYQTVAGLSVEMWFACNEEAPTGDINLRKAIAYALDRGALGYSVYRENGPAMNGIFATNWLDGDYGQSADEYYSQNMELARQYLSQSSYQGETLRCLVVTSMAQIGPLVQAYLQEAGINCELLNYDRATFNASVNDAAYGNYEIVINNCTSTGYSWLGLGYLSCEGYEGGLNRMFIKDDTLEELYAGIKQADAYSLENLKALDDYVRDNCYAIGLYSTNYCYFANDSVMSEIIFDATQNVNPSSCIYR